MGRLDVAESFDEAPVGVPSLDLYFTSHHATNPLSHNVMNVLMVRHYQLVTPNQYPLGSQIPELSQRLPVMHRRETRLTFITEDINSEENVLI